MKIKQIYQKYQIMPQLELHMMRVASVASLICDSLELVIDKDNIISACLLHDMGNILKFNLSLFPEFLKPKGLAYWQKVKADFQSRYGNDEHIATYQIVKELKVSNRVYELVSNFGFANFEKVYTTNDMSIKICTYSDHRVSPFGIMPLKAKISEGNKRFQANKPGSHDQQFFEQMCKFAQLTEEQIFKKSSINPEQVNDHSIAPYLQNLKDFEIHTN